MKQYNCLTVLLIAFFGVAGTGTAAECGGGTSCNCGDVVVEDITHENTLPERACPKTGLTITSDDLHVDCGGAHLTGQTKSHAGIVVKDAENVTIRGCQISGFYNGIDSQDSRKVALEQNTVYSNYAAGISLQSVEYGRVQGNRIRLNWDGIYLQNSSHNRLIRNKVRRNSVNGVHLFYGSTDNTIHNNSLEHNDGHGIATAVCSNKIKPTNTAGEGKPVLFVADKEGVRIEDTAEYAEIILCNVEDSTVRNVTIDNGPSNTDGILLVNASHNKIVDSIFRNVRTAAYLFRSSNDNYIANNKIMSSDIGVRVRRNSNLNIFQNNAVMRTENPVKIIRNASWNAFVDIELRGQEYTFTPSSDVTVRDGGDDITIEGTIFPSGNNITETLERNAYMLARVVSQSG